MVDRILLGQRGSDHGLWVSKPGVSVASATPSGLNFNSQWSAMPFEIQATHSIVWTAINSTQGNIQGGNTFVSFGKTYPSPPYVCFERVVGSAHRSIGGLGGFAHDKILTLTDPEYGWDTGTAVISIYGQVTTSGISLSGLYGKHRSTVATPSFVFRYTVYGYNI